MENGEMRKRSREEASEEEGLPEEKRFRSDILDILDDDEAEGTSESGAEELVNSMMKSLQDEIDGEEPPSREMDGGGQRGLGYLFEASDDELGLPPAGSDENKDAAGGAISPSLDSDIGGFWDFDDGLPGFAFTEFGLVGSEEEEDQVVVLDGLFDYSDYSQMGFWRHESMPAV